MASIADLLDDFLQFHNHSIEDDKYIYNMSPVELLTYVSTTQYKLVYEHLKVVDDVVVEIRMLSDILDMIMVSGYDKNISDTIH